MSMFRYISMRYQLVHYLKRRVNRELYKIHVLGPLVLLKQLVNNSFWSRTNP
jgi:hypothetical protein